MASDSGKWKRPTLHGVGRHSLTQDGTEFYLLVFLVFVHEPCSLFLANAV